VLICPTCGQENPEGFRFCGACAAPLAEELPAPRDERKVVSVVFCDLVGSTARAERMDPEDVRVMLSRYHGRVRYELERFGGTVEKFIGDAVMALFGAPVAHEDDPERAVRAALAIREWASEEGLQVRVGITTGEALVALAARPAAGEGMASGDVVNTAARLQSAAPVNGILVDRTTQRATARVVEYGEELPVATKGKAEAVPVWEVRQARSRVQVERGSRAPLMGRERELEVLLAALRRVREDREPQLVTLVGVPGIGKSRLVLELFQAIESGGELTFWRQGRSPAYGEEVSFWAFGEVVKAQAGILETDDGARTEEKLREAIAALVSDAADAQWLERHLRPLVGLEGGDVGSDRRGEAFAAWRRFLEALAEQRPLVLVLEDLHFADDGLLDFVDYLADWATGVPILVVATARPELLLRRPGWGGGKANAVTLSLAALSDEDTARLLQALLERPLLSAEVQATLLSRAGGNPLYAEEFVRLLAEHRPPEELPETVQGLIAARIDALPAEEKALLQDAAVLGKSFWLGATASLSAVERRAAEERLHALERKEFVRRERRSSVDREVEYAFRHLLMRDVAYGQIPRAARADKHLLAARWIEALGRPEDHAELLAHHYLSALELLRAARRSTADLAEPAHLALRAAGDRAFALNAFAHAAHLYEQASELVLNEDPARPEVLFRRAHALHLAAAEQQFEALEVARDALLRAGDDGRAAEAEALLARAWWFRGTWDRSRSAYERALALLPEGPPTAEKARVLAAVSAFAALEGEDEEAIRIGQDALAAADCLGLEGVRAAVLTTVGSARVELGDDAGLDDLEESRRVAVAGGALREAARACNNLAVTLYGAGELSRAFALLDEALLLGERAGDVDLVRFERGMMLLPALDGGRWDEGVRLADAFIAECEAAGGHTLQASVHCHRGSIRLARDDTDGAVADAERALDLALEVRQPDRVFQSLAFGMRAFAASGALERAREQAADFDFRALDRRRPPPAWSYVHFGWAAAEVGYAEELDRLLAGQRRQSGWIAATRAVLRGEYDEAAECFARVQTRPHEAYARLRAAGKLVADGRRAEADTQLEQALAFFRSVGATRYIREAEALLSPAAAAKPA